MREQNVINEGPYERRWFVHDDIEIMLWSRDGEHIQWHVTIRENKTKYCVIVSMQNHRRVVSRQIRMIAPIRRLVHDAPRKQRIIYHLPVELEKRLVEAFQQLPYPTDLDAGFMWHTPLCDRLPQYAATTSATVHSPAAL